MTETVYQQKLHSETLPNSWVWVTVEDIAAVASGQTPKGIKESTSEGEFSWFRVGDMNEHGNEKYMNLSKVNLTIQEVDDLRVRLQPPGTIIFPKRGGAIATNKKRILSKTSAYDLNTMGILPSGVDHSYVWYWFMTIDLGNLSDGSNVPQINNDDIQPLEVPLPPLNEQRRIVEKIEELFTKLDAGVRFLEQARAQLKSYRRSVLKAAVEGELSREWREAHRDDLEPASELLDRILQERQEEFTGKKYKEPASPDTSELPALPDGWASATVDQLSREVRYGSSAKTNEESNGIPVLRMGNIKDGQLVTNALKYLPEAHGEFPELLLEPGDLLFNRTNSSELVGKTAIYTGTPEPSSFASYLIRVRFLSEVLPDFVSYFINSIYGRQWISSVVSQQVGQANVNGTKLKALRVPLPPTKEQLFIVEEVERRLSVVDKLEATVEENLKQAAGLRQSILKQAFSGELVPQDPDDEPADVLLARIRSEREATKPKARRPRKVREDDEAQGRLI